MAGGAEMSKKKNRKNIRKNIKRKADNWGIPKNAADYFDPHYDDEFKHEHPVLYFLTVTAIIACVVVGPILYLWLSDVVQPGAGNSVEFKNWFEFLVWGVGFISSFAIGIGLCNLFLRLHKQYLGHYVTLWSFAIGIAGAGLSLLFIWLI